MIETPALTILGKDWLRIEPFSDQLLVRFFAGEFESGDASLRQTLAEWTTSTVESLDLPSLANIVGCPKDELSLEILRQQLEDFQNLSEREKQIRIAELQKRYSQTK